MSNTGNTTSAFNVNLFLANTAVPSGVTTQLVLYKTYKTPVAAPNGCELSVETRNVLISSVPSPMFVTSGASVPDPNDPSEKNATLWLAPGEVARITLRVYDPDRSDNIIYTNADGTTASIDPAFNPQTQVTPGISGQGVDPLDPPGATQPPIVTPTGSNLFFLQQPTTAGLNAAIAPAVTVRTFDNTGAGLPGVLVALSLAVPGTATLSGNTAMSSASGVAIFPLLSVDTPGTYQLIASAASPGVVATAVSNPFTISLGTIPASVTITDWAAIYNNEDHPVTVTTVPPGLATSVTYNGSATPPTAIGAYLVQATITAPGYIGSASVTQTIANTLSAGGPGGGPYPALGALSCGPGVFATGMRVAVNGSPTNDAFGFIGYAVTSASLLCGPAESAKFGGGTTPNANLSCSPGDVMVGIFGTQSNVVTSIGPRCQTPGSVDTTQPVGALPNNGGTPFSFTCPAGHAVTGVVGGQGAVLDSAALVCGVIPPAGPAVNAATPSTLAAFQYVTITGANLPATTQNDVLFSQGGPEHASDYLFTAGSTMVIARVPTGVLTDGPATVRLKNGPDTVTTNAFPITISGTPGAPVLTSLLNQCSGGTRHHEPVTRRHCSRSRATASVPPTPQSCGHQSPPRGRCSRSRSSSPRPARQGEFVPTPWATLSYPCLAPQRVAGHVATADSDAVGLQRQPTE